MRGVGAVLRARRGRGGDPLVAGVALTGAVLVVTLVLAAVMGVGATDAMVGAAGEGSFGHRSARFVEAPIPRGAWGLDWGDGVRPPTVEQARQVAALRSVTGAAAGLVAVLAAMIAVALLRQRDRWRRAETYVHWAVGARPIHLAAGMLAASWPWMGVLLLSGVAGGLVLPRLLAGTFPGAAEIPQSLAASLVVAAALLVVAVRWEGRAGRRSVGEGGRLGRVLTSPGAVAAVGFAVLTGIGLLARHAPGVSAASDVEGLPGLVGSISLDRLPAEARGPALSAWSRRARAVASARVSAPDEELRAGIASAGASRGAGHGARIWVECGDCYEGGLPMPLKTVRAEVHAVGADTFPQLGLAIVEGRDFDDGRDVGAADVAIVTRALAVRHFEGGEAVGRRIRVGASAWLTVVGVVGDPPDARNRTEYSVYLPLTQSAPTHVEILATSQEGLEPWLRTAPEAVGEATIRTGAEVFAVHGWFVGLLRGVGMVAWLLVGLGVWLGSRGEARATAFELSLRRALGARRRDVHVHFLASSGRRMALSLGAGAWLSLFLGAGLEGAYGSIPHVDVVVWLRVGAVIASIWILGAWPGFVRSRRLSPAVGLRVAGAEQ